MNSFTGNIAYAKFEKGTTKGESKKGDLVNNPWQFGTMDQNYTGAAVASEEHAYDAVNTGLNTTFPVYFLPLIEVTHVTLFNGTTKERDLVAGTDYTVNVVDGEVVGTITLTTPLTSGKSVKVSYVYNNTRIPQEPDAKLPTLKVEMDTRPLVAKARRIAVRYSQLAA